MFNQEKLREKKPIFKRNREERKLLKKETGGL